MFEQANVRNGHAWLCMAVFVVVDGNQEWGKIFFVFTKINMYVNMKKLV